MNVLLVADGSVCFDSGAGGSACDRVTEQPEELLREEKEPPSRDNPVSMMRAEIFSQAKKVRSFAKKVLGSTRVLTSAFDLHSLL